MPERIQLRRTKGWRKPEGAIVVSRPSRWGNWYVVRRNRIVVERHPESGYATRIEPKGPHWVVAETDKHGWDTGSHWGTWDTKEAATAFAVELYRRALEATYVDLDGPLNREFYLGELRGHDLACWCPEGSPCHADVLLELANPTEATNAR